jgi:hypothetical protein
VLRLQLLRIGLLGCTLASCTGAIELTVGPGAGDNDGNSVGDGDGEGPLGEAPAGIGTDIFALCEEGAAEQPGPRLLRLMTRREYRNTVRDLLFVEAPDTSSLPVESRVRGFDDNAAAAVVTGRHIDEYLKLGEALAADAVQNHKGQLVPCDAGESGCARTFVERFGLRAFRRPLTGDEVDRYVALVDAGDDFDDGLRLAITGMLVSPSFLYRSEVGEPVDDGRFELTQYELASALSYLYWGSMPDATLFEAAAQGTLDSPERLETEAGRLLEDPRAREQLGEFSLQWLRSDGLVAATKDPTLYPSFNDDVREAMLEEQHRFVAQVVLDDQGSFEDLFRANFVVANGMLASFYGLTSAGDGFASIEVDAASGRGGLLSLGAVLAAHAHSMESSPIKRGLFVRDRLLCQNMPPPPADLDTTPPGLDPTLTTRERFARHTSDSGCASCHQFIDGVGFGFEGFDGVGARRTRENDLDVDESGSLIGLEGLDEKTEHEFTGPRELAALLADSESAQACLALQYYRFARGYEERRSDACSLRALQERFENAELTVKELLVALPTLRSFVVRKE